MRSILSALLLLIVAGMLVSCDSGNTGDFKIRLRLPIDINEVCSYYDKNDPDAEDYTYCITEGDQILLEIYSTKDAAEPYAFAQSKLIPVKSSRGGKENFIRSLKNGNYYRFFVFVTNANEKLKLTGGIDGVYYDDSKNYEVDLFLGATTDFVRVVKDRKKYEDTSLRSYFDSSGSRGSAAVALKGGLIYLSGGYSFDYEAVMPNTTVFNMHNLSSANEDKLRTPLEYHAAALLDDGTQYGKAVIAFGTGDDGSYSSNIWLFDPEKGRYTPLESKESVTKAKAISIGGKVYIAGGCNESSASSKVYVVDNQPPYTITEFASMNTARCNHAIADVSTVDESGAVTPRILIIGGSSDLDGEDPIVGDNMVELAVAGSSKPLPLTDRKGEDSVDLTANGLVSPAASTLRMDDLGEVQKVVAVVGGHLKDGSDENATITVSKNLYVFSEKSDGKGITYDVNTAPEGCARPSMATIGTTEKSPAQYAALNCGTPNLDTDSKATETQKIFVVQVKRSFDNEFNMNVLSASVKESLMDENRDSENGVILDGPTVVNDIGQAFVFGTEYVYQISGRSIPY